MKSIVDRVLGGYALLLVLLGVGFAYPIVRDQCRIEANAIVARNPLWDTSDQNPVCRLMIGRSDLVADRDARERFAKVGEIELASERWGAMGLVATIALGVLGSLFSLAGLFDRGSRIGPASPNRPERDRREQEQSRLLNGDGGSAAAQAEQPAERAPQDRAAEQGIRDPREPFARVRMRMTGIGQADDEQNQCAAAAEQPTRLQ